MFVESLPCAIFFDAIFSLKKLGMYHVYSYSISCGYDFLTENVGHGRRIPNITYPQNNTIEVQLGE